MQSSKQLSSFAPVVLRFALVAVFMWFGVSQLMNARMWTGLVPSWAADLSGLSASKIVRFNGAMEIIGASFLTLGIFVRWVAFALFVHLFVIASQMGITPVGVRDFGLSFATLAIALNGDDRYCLLYKPDGAGEA